MASGAVIASIASGAGIAVVNFAAGAVSGSAGMFAAGVRSAVDCANESLLAVGQARGKKPADDLHPFGYGRELYFWTLVVASVLFTIAGLGTIAKGVMGILDPKPLEKLGWSYAALGLGAVFCGYAWWKAFREFRAGQGEYSLSRGLWKAKDPTTLTILFNSTAGLVGLPVAFLGLLLGDLLHAPVLDGVASVLIGLLMAVGAVGLMYQCKYLLVGASATDELQDDIRKQMQDDEAVGRVVELLTVQNSPKDVVTIMTVQFRDGLDAAAVAEAIHRIGGDLRKDNPELTRVFIQPAQPTPTTSPGEHAPPVAAHV